MTKSKLFTDVDQHVIDNLNHLVERADSESTVFIPEGFTATLAPSRPRRIATHFQPISSLKSAEWPNNPMDIFDLLHACSRGAFTLFIKLKYARDSATNLCTLVEPYTNASEAVKHSRAVSELKKKGLIKKVRQSSRDKQEKLFTYMINPAYLMPREPETAQTRWAGIK